jgi:hypothetical protein
MTRRYTPPDGVLREGFYCVNVDGRPAPDVAYWNGYVWYLIADSDAHRDLFPISKPLEPPR